MGQRLIMTIKDNDVDLMKVYYHWSAYTVQSYLEALNVIIMASDCNLSCISYILYKASYELINMEVLLGTIIFCSSFLACDIITLEYGENKAKYALYLTMFTDVFFLINILLTLSHKPIDYAQYPEFSISKETMNNNIFAIKQIFLPVPRLLIASYVSYFCSQLIEIKFLSFIRKTNTILKHNLILFISNVFLDTLIFTFLGMCVLSNEPLKLHDFFKISASAILIRIICNFFNSFCIKILFKNKCTQ